MNAVVLLVVGVAILVAGYIFYGGWLAKQWGLGENKEETPAHTMEDGQDYVPAKAPVLMGHHFSSIAGAGPIKARNSSPKKCCGISWKGSNKTRRSSGRAICSASRFPIWCGKGFPTN